MTGTVTRAAVRLSLQGVIDLSGGGKPAARCTFGPQRWILRD